MAFGAQNFPHTIDNLKRSSIRIAGTYKEQVLSGGSRKSGEKSYLAEYQHELEGVEKESDIDEEVYLLKKKKSTKNRPGKEQMAVKRTNDATNMPNATFAETPDAQNAMFFGKGGIFCYRCGKDDHVIRNCPFPYTATLAFAPQKGGSPQKGKSTGMPDGEGSSNGAFFAANETSAQTGNSTDAHEASEQNEQIVSAHQNVTVTNDNGGDLSDQQWLSGWFEEECPHDAFTAQRFGNEEWMYYDAPDQTSALRGDIPRNHEPLIDCGASKTVAGLLWLLSWLSRSSADVMQMLSPSNRVFRFGNVKRHNSLGRIVVGGKVSGWTAPKQHSVEVLSIEADVIALDIPFLISNFTLSQMKACIDFGAKILHVSNKFWVQLKALGGRAFGIQLDRNEPPRKAIAFLASVGENIHRIHGGEEDVSERTN